MLLEPVNKHINEALKNQSAVIFRNAKKYIDWLNSDYLKSDDLSPIMSSTWKIGNEKSLVEFLRKVKRDVKFETLDTSLNEERNLVTVWLTCPGGQQRYFYLYLNRLTEIATAPILKRKRGSALLSVRCAWKYFPRCVEDSDTE
jgi:hypothetical protein